MNKTLSCSLALMFALSGTAPVAAATTKGPAAGKSVKVGVIADVTGSAAVYGTMQKNAYDLANDDIKAGIIDAGGANLSFDVEDAASDGARVEDRRPIELPAARLCKGRKVLSDGGDRMHRGQAPLGRAR